MPATRGGALRLERAQHGAGIDARRGRSLIGWGVAIGAYPGLTVPAIARLRVTENGGVFIGVGGHEMGQGIRSALAAAVARKLGVRPEQVTTEIGDTSVAPQHLTAGSWGTASAVPAAADAADAMLKALAELSPHGPPGRTPAQILTAAGRPSLEVEIKRKGPGQPDQIFGRLVTGLPAIAGPHYPDFVTFSYIAHFVEVRVEPSTRRVRVPRVVSVADVQNVTNDTKSMLRQGG
jgi:xanthine dehydrogenase YagR molybdenum-binding subunit